jgi:hypothetical protein
MSFSRRALHHCVVLVLIALVASAGRGDAAEVRTWTDVAGRKTDAKFVRVFNGEVILERDGRMLKVPLARFSAADQKHIGELTASPASSAAAPTKAEAAGPQKKDGPATTPAAAKGEKGATDAAKEPDAKAAAVELKRLRDWRDNAGNVVKARFERIFGQQVVLSAGNRLRTVEFSRLSAADQEFVRKNLEAQGLGGDVPATVAQTPAESATNAADAVASPSGGAAGLPGSSFPTFGDLAGRMREHHDQIRATQEQLRSQVKQMHDEMRAARERTPRPAIPRPTAPETAPLPAAVAEVVGSDTASSNSAIASHAPPAVPDLSMPSHTPPRGAAAPVHDPFAASAAAGRPERAIPRSPFERNSIAHAPETQANDPFAAAPSMEPQYQAVIICGACNKPQKPGFKAGQRCQHCGQTIDEIEDESGNVVERSSSSTRRNVKFWVWAVIAGISVIGGLIAKIRGG